MTRWYLAAALCMPLALSTPSVQGEPAVDDSEFEGPDEFEGPEDDAFEGPEEAPADEDPEPQPADPAEEPPAVDAPDETRKEPEVRPTAPPKRFQEGLSAFYGDNFEAAAARMYDYVATNEPTAENYDWAEYFLGASLSRLGFRQGASEYLYNVAKNRSSPEVLPEALVELEKIVNSGPFDEALIIDRLFVDSDFGYLPPYISSFVRYHQGLADLRAGRLAWAKRLFDQIPEDDPYYPEAQYALGVERLKKKKDPEAVRLFRLALVHPQSDRELRNLCRLALARVLYEEEEYADALRIYDQVEVPELSTAEASLFLEKAWAHYWLRDFRQTMGILYALEAPSYRDFYSPEKFLLRSLIYMNMCHYIPAKREIRRFRFRFQSPLESIRSRIDLREDEVLRNAALQDGKIGRMADLRRMLAREADDIDTVGGAWIETGLDEQLRKIYRLAIRRTDLRLNAMLSAESRRVAEELVEFEEQMYLLDYEVGLAIYRRLRKEDARRETEQDDLGIPIAGDQTYFAFDGEFWNDELPTYDFYIENRCFDQGGTE